MSLTPVWWVAIGGFMGGLCRYWASVALPMQHFIWNGILAVNLVGCFLIGVAQTARAPWLREIPVRLGISVGFIGSLTTFSSFSFDAAVGMRTQVTGGAIYLFVSVVGGLAMTYLGAATPAFFRHLIRVARGWTT